MNAKRAVTVPANDALMIADPESATTDWSRGGLDDGDLQFPYLNVLQQMSPVANPADADYVEGAKAGMLFLSSTQEVINPATTSMLVLPCFRERVYNEFTADRFRGERGDWLGSYAGAAADDLRRQSTRGEKGLLRTPAGNALQEVLYFYVLFARGEQALKDANLDMAVMSFRSTQIRKARTWTTRIENLRVQANGKQVRAVPWYGVFSVNSEAETSGQYSWWGWSIQPVGLLPNMVDDVTPIHEACKQLMQQANDFGIGARSDTTPVTQAPKPEVIDAPQLAADNPVAEDGDMF